jgi:hypothetical protein
MVFSRTQVDEYNPLPNAARHRSKVGPNPFNYAWSANLPLHDYGRVARQNEAARAADAAACIGPRVGKRRNCPLEERMELEVG